jgi:hypothetical protein
MQIEVLFILYMHVGTRVGSTRKHIVLHTDVCAVVDGTAVIARKSWDKFPRTFMQLIQPVYMME